jgi:prepilin-type N-terminal cleavage/methylation domain-containing protein
MSDNFFIEKKSVLVFGKINKRGFTLVELIIVIAIIGLMVAIALVVTNFSGHRARDAKGESDLRKIMTAFELKYHQNEEYPDLPYAAESIPSSPPDTRLSPYIIITPYSNSSRNYQWYNSGDNQKFCVFFQYESKQEYFTCSHKGCQTNAEDNCPNF